MKVKAEVLNILYEYKERSEIELKYQGCRITNIRLDCSGENLFKPVKEFCRTHGINLEPSLAYAKQIIREPERFVQEDWACARVMLFSCNFPNILWPEAVFHCKWLGNRQPASRIDAEIPLKTSYIEARIDYTKLLDFGTSEFA